MGIEPGVDNSSGWLVVGSREAVVEAGLLEVHVGRHVVLLAEHAARISAFQGLCPHQMARLAEGIIVDGKLQCPRHLAQFDLADGTCSGGWQLNALRRYEVRLNGDDIMLQVPLVAID